MSATANFSVGFLYIALGLLLFAMASAMRVKKKLDDVKQRIVALEDPPGLKPDGPLEYEDSRDPAGPARVASTPPDAKRPASVSEAMNRR